MKKIFNIFDEFSEIIVTLIIVFVIFFFVFNKRKEVDSMGIITIAKVNRWESAESGSSLYISIYFEDKKYTTILNKSCESYCIGNYYFIKINKDSPTDYPIFYEDEKVPDCITHNIKYFTGWKQIPTCDNYASPPSGF
jgi:hypothetical protein